MILIQFQIIINLPILIIGGKALVSLSIIKKSGNNTSKEKNNRCLVATANDNGLVGRNDIRIDGTNVDPIGTRIEMLFLFFILCFPLFFFLVCDLQSIC